jgi:hypothetical protein
MSTETQKAPRVRLTAKQRRLRDEIRELTELLRLDPERVIQEAESAGERTTRLELIREQLIRSEVIFQYTLVTEMIDSLVATYYFGPFSEKRGFTYFWRTKKFQNFNYYILEPLPLIKKFELLNDVMDIPKTIGTNLYAMNDLRNALAHAFFPENLRRYRSKGERDPSYKGQSIRSMATVKRFMDDVWEIQDWYFSRSGKGFRKRRSG